MLDEDNELLLSVTDAGPYVVVRAVGDLDLEGAPALTAELRSWLGPRPVVLDLSGVDFMDSSGLGVLVGAHKEAGNRGGALILAAPSPRVQKIFKVTRLHKVFSVHDTPEDAVEAALRSTGTVTNDRS
ncbi:STAS domain-containing protein [Kribbella sp. NPDC048915]|uniref:STAS domain-containing protein n=1 Tax=Kribbella sp. NPDC048915 TaxID=3155148 RepID=UPI0033C41F3A